MPLTKMWKHFIEEGLVGNCRYDNMYPFDAGEGRANIRTHLMNGEKAIRAIPDCLNGLFLKSRAKTLLELGMLVEVNFVSPVR